MKVPSGYEGYPPHWRVLDQLGPSLYPATGFKRDFGYARRFGARYRFATSVTEIVLKGYASADTKAGYSALTRLAFTYTAFEAMLHLIGVKKSQADELLRPYPVAEWVKELTALDPHHVLFGFIVARLDAPRTRTHVEMFLAGQPCDVSALAAALRHIFFHGELTPNAAGADPQVVVRICEYLIRVLVIVMDREIAVRLAPLERKAPPRPADEYDEDIPF